MERGGRGKPLRFRNPSHSFGTRHPSEKGPADLDRCARSPYPWDTRLKAIAWDVPSRQHPGGARRNSTKMTDTAGRRVFSVPSSSASRKSTLGRLKFHSQRVRNGARIVQGRLGAVRNTQDRIKIGPRASQEPPKSVQERPKSSQETSKRSPKGAQETPKGARETPGGPKRDSKRAQIERKSRKNRFRNASRYEYRF